MLKRLLYLIILVAALSACSEQEKTYKIGVSQCSSGRWRDKVNQEMLAAQHLYEADAEVVIAQSYDDTGLQIRQIDSLADAGIDLLVVAPNESAPIAEAIARTQQKGIPVIFFDRKAKTAQYTAFIGGNNEEAGQMMGNYIKRLEVSGERLEVSGERLEKTKVLEITGAMSSSPAQERHEGFKRGDGRLCGHRLRMPRGRLDVRQSL